jgi:hypothetical protein
MDMNRRRVFQLLQTGRITAAEAERLMAAWQASRERMWILMGCIGIGLMAVLNLGVAPVVQSLVHTLKASELIHAGAAMVVGLGTSLGG